MAGNNPSQRDDPLVIVPLALGFIIGICAIIWIFEKPWVIFLFYLTDIPQYFALHFFHMLNNFGNSIGGYLYKVIFYHGKNAIDKNSISWAEISTVQQDIGHRLWWLYAGIMALLTYRIFRKMKGRGLLHIFMIKPMNKKITSFISYQSEAFPLSASGVGFDPEKADSVFDPPIGPFNFMLQHKIGMTRKGGVDREKLRALFEAQIGDEWAGFDKEPFYRQAVLLICMTNLQYPLKKGDNGAAGLNAAFAKAFYAKKSKAEIEEDVKRIIRKQVEFDKKLKTEIDRVIKGKFYFSRTAAVGMLGYCGPFRHWGGGYSQMLPPVTFQWLQQWDRTLFLALNSVGTRGMKAFIEGAGVISHFLVEYNRGSHYSSPYVTAAIDAVPYFLTEELQDSAKVYDMDQAKRALMKVKERRYRG